MAKGINELIEFLLDETALCGAQGAGSADFRRYIHNFYEERSPQSSSSNLGLLPGGLDRRFYETVWTWFVKHHDVRLIYQNKPQNLSLAEFEALEPKQKGAKKTDDALQQKSASTQKASRAVTKPQASLRELLRQRLSAEGQILSNGVHTQQIQNGADTTTPSSGAEVQAISSPEKIVNATEVSTSETAMRDTEPADGNQAATEDHASLQKIVRLTTTSARLSGKQVSSNKAPEHKPTFDNTPDSMTAPRIIVSQSRTWRAVAGHSADTKKLSSMQFALLSVIAAHGAKGILQPELVKISKQDKRSVPHRTDELAKAGYIEKQPVQSSGMRTSICVHKKFIKEGHFLRGHNSAEDVFRDRTVILSNLIGLLHDILKEVKILPLRDLRRKLGVSMQEWTTRGIRSAIRRLEETGFLRRNRALAKGSRKGNTIVVIQLLRPPQDDDIINLSFRGKRYLPETSGPILEEDEEGDDVMRDLDLALDFDDGDVGSDRIPPQWIPERLFPNLAYEAIKLAGIEGTDASKLRDRTMGKFWKRPTESYIARLTDNWEQSQPLHLRHLALVRDTTVTDERRLVHYIYRTHGNFQKAVDDGQAAWEDVSREALAAVSTDKRGRPKKNFDQPTLNQWGFHNPSLNDLRLHTGASTLVESNAAVEGRRWYVKRSENAESVDQLSSLSTTLPVLVGARRRGRPPGSKSKKPRATAVSYKYKAAPVIGSKRPHSPDGVTQEATKKPRDSDTPNAVAFEAAEGTMTPGPSTPQPGSVQPILKVRKGIQAPIPLLSAEQRRILGLPPRGRLGLHIEQQIRDHREKTGDPVSLPEMIYMETVDTPGVRKPKRKRSTTKPEESRLFTNEFRKYYELPEKGRLHQNVINHYREMERNGTLPVHLIPDPPRTKKKSRFTSLQDSDAEEASQDYSGSEDGTPVATGTKRKANGQISSPNAAKRLRADNDENPATPGGDPVLTTVEYPDQSLQDGEAVKAANRSLKAKEKIDGSEAENEAVRRFNERSGPGVYIDPSPTRRVPRGRPKNAMVAVFISTRLDNFPWFQAEAAPEKPPIRPRPKKSVQGALKKPTTPSSKRSLLLQPKPLEEPLVEGLAIQKDSSTSSAKHNSDVPGIPGGTSTESPIVPDSGLARTTPVAVDHAATVQPSHVQEQVESVPVATSPAAVQSEPGRPSPQKSLSGSVPTWNAINASNFTQPEESQSSRIHQPARSEAGSDYAPAAESGTPAGSDDETTILSRPDYHALGYKRKPNFGAFSKRGVTLSRGSVWRLRTTIILDILQRCNGVFPFNGEFVLPFFKIWEQRALKTKDKTKCPDRNAITNLVNNMVKEPSGPQIVKHWFRIPTLDGSAHVERYIISWKDIPATDPRIEAMKANITRTYPKKYYPPEILEFVDYDPDVIEWAKHDEPEFDPSIKIPGFVAEEMLDKRVSTAAEKRKIHTDRKKAEAERLRSIRKEDQTDQNRPGRLGTLNKGVNSEIALNSLKRFPKRRASSPTYSDSSSDSSSDEDEDEACLKMQSDLESNATLVKGDTFINVKSSNFARHCRYRNGSNRGTIQNATPSAFGSPNSEKTWEFIMEEYPKQKKRKRVRFDGIDADFQEECRAKNKANQLRAKLPPPTVVERLTGLTGDPNDPIYVMPRRKDNRGSRSYKMSWVYKGERAKKEPRPPKVVEILDPAETFRKLLCTLTIASCMSGQDGSVDWDIVSKVYSSDASFDLEKVKKIWPWIQQNMAVQCRDLNENFQSSFLAAYESGSIASIEDPETYDWAALVRWALRTCKYSEAPLPSRPELLHDFVVEESLYQAFNRTEWTEKKLAHVVRAQRALKYTFACPIHSGTTRPRDDDIVCARSWIRSNTATNQDVYDKDLAHEKLKRLGHATLERVVDDLKKEYIIRQRKVKRLLPGRNYDFTARFAIRYRRAFEATVFPDAVEFKKKLDAAFANEDPEQRFVDISRSANDGSVMALLTLVNEGRVKIVPVLPPTTTDVRTEHPRISSWGIVVGDYSNRKIERKRLFFKLHAIPTSSYQFGNPLQPSPNPPRPGGAVEWRPLPEPPLPGKHDPNATLPIWSSIDGQHVTWPWWQRILNIVIQAIMFQPGASAAEIHAHCPGGAAELFEVELVLDWLMSTNAVQSTGKGTFKDKAGCWAALGEKLLGQDDDWFGEHVRRTKLPDSTQAHKHHYNNRSPRVQALLDAANEATGSDDEDENMVGPPVPPPNYQPLKISHLQRPVRKNRPFPEKRDVVMTGVHKAAVADGDIDAEGEPDPDVVMVDADIDAEGEPDIDAEGEPDDEML